MYWNELCGKVQETQSGGWASTALDDLQEPDEAWTVWGKFEYVSWDDLEGYITNLADDIIKEFTDGG